jgi:hypothetical protein
MTPVSSHHLSDTDVPNDFQLMMEMARELAGAEHFLPTELQGKPGNVLALMLRARALNIPFAVACDELYIQRRSNKVAQSARLVRALARRAGHKFMTLQSDRHHCVLLIQLAGEREPRRVEFTMQDAHRMGLTDPAGNNKGGQWDKQPENMLYARATTRAVSRYCPEVMLGMGSDFLYDESPNEDDVPRDQEDVLAAYREEDQKLVAQVLEAVKDTEYLEDGAERESILMKLGMDYPQVLAYAADETKEFTVRDVLLGKLAAAKSRKEAQARGEAVPPATPFPSQQAGEKAPVKGDGPARARKAAGGRTGARARAAEEKAKAEAVVDAEVVEDAPVKKTAARKAPAKKAPAKTPAARKAVAKKTAAPAAARLRAKAPAAKTAPSPTGEGFNKAGAAPVDEKLMPCGCPADLVMFEDSHLKSCKGTEK